MNTKGASLAINQVVIIIVSVVILGLAIAFLGKIFATADHALPPVDERLEAELRNSLGDNIVEIPRSTKKMRAGDLGLFTLGMLNDPSVSTGNQFSVLVSFDTGVKRDNSLICTSAACKSSMLTEALLLPPEFSTNAIGRQATYTLDDNELEVINFGLVPKDASKYAGRGQYFYNVCVCEGPCGMPSCTATEYAGITNGYGYVTFSAIVE